VEWWGWTADARANVPIEIYSNCESVELLLNGRSLGESQSPTVRFRPALACAESGGPVDDRKERGTVAARFELRSPARRRTTTPSLSKILDGGRWFPRLKSPWWTGGNRVPGAGQAVTFEVSGPGRLLAVGNADLTDSAWRPATLSRSSGRAVAWCVRAGQRKISLRHCAWLAPAETVIMAPE
jgi:beta-galactosidase